MRPKTLLIHGGAGHDRSTGAVNVPIYLSSTYAQEAPGRHRGFEYARTGNPTRAALELLIAQLEGGARGLAFASGMAAVSAVLSLLSAGDHVVVGDDVYGGTYRVVAKVFGRLGIAATFVDTTVTAAVEAALTPHTRMILVESPSNPMLKVSDIAALAKVAHGAGALLAVDNTFLTPYWQNPLTLGADIVVHSATKYLSGHSDVVAGLVVAATEELGEKLHFLQNATGGVLGVQDSWLLLRGVRTLGPRLEEHERNARRLAGWLRERPWVRQVYYPGLADHPGHALASRQARGYGGMLAFAATDPELAEKIVTSTRLFTLAESLGGVESLISLPARMTHASLPPDRRAALGITGSLVRISVGLEDIADLLEDLAAAAGGG